jgi:Tol biopolymer transport system component/DNA-binding winged helix-turn-helix (wHTH) protein
MTVLAVDGVFMPSEKVQLGQFVLDVSRYELTRDGTPVRLERIPMDLLILLVRGEGKLIGREEIIERLWGKDVYFDTDNSINTAVRKIRRALGEDPEKPQYIETVQGKGYRFKVQLGPANGNGEKSVPTDLDAKTALVETGIGALKNIPAPGKLQEASPGRSVFKRAGAIAGVAVVVLIGVAYWRSEPEPPTVVNTVRITNDGKAKNPLNPAVTDGLHLYFTEGMPSTSGSGIAQVSAAGGETTLIPTTLKNVLAVSSVSPDRSELMVSKVGTVGSEPALELWVQPLPAGTPHRAGNIQALLATWTPDGSQIVYPVGDTIMMANKDGSEPHPLAKVSGIVFAIRYSPDGRRIRFDFTDPQTDSNSIWEMDANGKNIHPLFPGWKESPIQSGGNWSPDGDYYYFQAGRGNAQAIWVMPEHRSLFRRRAQGPSRLITGPLRLMHPVPSSDGKKLFVLGEERRVELMRYDLQERRYDAYLSGLSAGSVDFSADGKWMAYVSYPDMNLWRSRVDGSEKMQLTFPPARTYGPRWSPDGSQIAYMDVRFDRAWKICVLSASGGNPEVLTQSTMYEADPTWTPDGKSIVFGKSDRIGEAAIYRLDLETRRVSAIHGSDGLSSPRVSPDGRSISALTTGQTKLMLFDTNTNVWSSLADGEDVGYNEWSHDGKYIYFRENRGGAGELVRLRVKDRVLEHLVGLKDFPQLSDEFASWIGLTPDDAPLLMRDRSVQEIYALELRFH